MLQLFFNVLGHVPGQQGPSEQSKAVKRCTSWSDPKLDSVTSPGLTATVSNCQWILDRVCLRLILDGGW